MARPTVSKIAEDVSYLQQDMAKVGVLVDRLDETIDKLAEVSSSLSQLLAVHESRITAQDILVKSLQDLVEKRREEMDDNIKLLHARISSGEKELEEDLENKKLMVLEELKEMRVEANKQHEEMSNRITTLEKWMWIAIGAFTALSFLTGSMDLSAFMG